MFVREVPLTSLSFLSGFLFSIVLCLGTDFEVLTCTPVINTSAPEIHIMMMHHMFLQLIPLQISIIKDIFSTSKLTDEEKSCIVQWCIYFKRTLKAREMQSINA